MAYVDSSEIFVFPSARRGQVSDYSEARTTTETAIANIVNRLIDVEGFLITDPDTYNNLSSSDKGTALIEFNLYGYYFRVNNASDILSSFSTISPGDVVYAVIALTPIASGSRYELYGQDDGGSYQGVQFNTSGTYVNPPSGAVTYSLPLFTYVSASVTWELVDSSAFKLAKKSLNFSVDGGEI